MAFDDLEDTLEEQDQEDDEPTETTMDATEIDATSDESDDVQDDVDDDPDPSPRPAFEFDDSKQDALYARPEAWESFEDMLDLDLESELRDRGIRDAPKREKHDAVLRFAAEHPEEIADLIESERQ